MMGVFPTIKAVLYAGVLLFLQQGIQIPAPVGLVNDFANVLDAEAEARMARIAEDVRAKSPGEIAIVTLPDLGGRDVEQVATQIGRQWKLGDMATIGDPTRNAGVVILLVPKETANDGRGRCFIATGYGAEGFITDATSGTICREATPLFAAGDNSGGLELVTLRTAERFAREFKLTLDTTLVPPPQVSRGVDFPSGDGGGIPPQLIFLIFIVILVLLSRGRRKSRKSKPFLESWVRRRPSVRVSGTPEPVLAKSKSIWPNGA